jgi:hypothetical protein
VPALPNSTRPIRCSRRLSTTVLASTPTPGFRSCPRWICSALSSFRTVQGALLIALRRPDLVRADDLALRHSIQAHYGLDHLPDATEVEDLARRWSPYRSLASSLLLAAARSS